MEGNELKVIEIKNDTCYYFGDTTKTEDDDFDDILMKEKLCKNILVYDTSYKTLFGWKPLRIRFNEIEKFIRVDDKIRYLVLFGSNKNDYLQQN